eukprot:191670_1
MALILIYIFVSSLYLIDAQIIKLSATNCNDFYHLNNFETSDNNKVGELVISEYFEIEFDIKINSYSSASLQNLFRIGNSHGERLPGVWLRNPNNGYSWLFRALCNDNKCGPSGDTPSIDLTDPSPSIGELHHFYMAITPTEYIIIIDGIENNFNGNFDRSQYIGQIHGMFFSEDSATGYPSADVILSNICVRSSSIGLSTEYKDNINEEDNINEDCTYIYVDIYPCNDFEYGMENIYNSFDFVINFIGDEAVTTFSANDNNGALCNSVT